MENIASEVAGEGATFEEAAENAVEKRYRGLEAEGAAPKSREWLKVIRIEVEAESHNQWIRTFRVVIPGK